MNRNLILLALFAVPLAAQDTSPNTISLHGNILTGVHLRADMAWAGRFVVLDRDLTTATLREILHGKVLRTVLGGKTAFAAGAR